MIPGSGTCLPSILAFFEVLVVHLRIQECWGESRTESGLPLWKPGNLEDILTMSFFSGVNGCPEF